MSDNLKQHPEGIKTLLRWYVQGNHAPTAELQELLANSLALIEKLEATQRKL